MHIDHHFKITKQIKNILIIQLGDVGDVVWTTPSFKAVKETFPHAGVSVLLREGTACLFEADPYVEQCFEVKHYKGHLLNRVIEQIRFVRILRRKHFDIAFDLRSDDRGAFMARLTGAEIRGALYYRDVPFLRNRLFTHLLVEPSQQKKKVLGAAEQSLRILRGFGIHASSDVPKLWIMPDVMKQAQQILHRAGCVDSNDHDGLGLITLNPFSRWSYKEWDSDKWVSIMNWLWNRFHIASAVVGNKEESARATELVNRCSGTVYNLAGKTTLAELAGVLSFSGLHIGVDSAAPHIAAAVGTPTITIYGPSDWQDWAPVGEMHRVIVPDMECVPCRKKGCDGSEQSRCLETLEIDKVQTVIGEELEKRSR